MVDWRRVGRSVGHWATVMALASALSLFITWMFQEMHIEHTGEINTAMLEELIRSNQARLDADDEAIDRLRFRFDQLCERVSRIELKLGEKPPPQAVNRFKLKDEHE